MSVTKHARIINSQNLVSSLFSVHLNCKFVGCSLISRWRRKSYRQWLMLALKNNIVYFSLTSWSYSVSVLNHAQPAILPSLYTSVRTRRASSQNRFCRRRKYSLLLLRLVRLRYFWVTDGVVIRLWRRRGEGREEGGRNTLSQVGTITQKSGFWMQLFEMHFARAPPPHLNLQLCF